MISTTTTDNTITRISPPTNPHNPESFFKKKKKKKKTPHVYISTPHQKPIQIKSFTQLLSINIVDTPAIDDSCLLARLVRHSLGHPFTDGGVDFLCLLEPNRISSFSLSLSHMQKERGRPYTSVVATFPVPMAQMGSYATTILLQSSTRSAMAFN